MTEKFDHLTDLEVIQKVMAGEKALYELIVRRYNSYLYKIGRSYNYDHEDTQDLMQDSFVDAYKNLAKYEGRSSFKTWLVRIMMNNCFRKKEKSSFKYEINREILENSTPAFNNSNNDTMKTIHNKELGNVIEKALSKIPFDYRMVFSLREINGLNIADTSQLLNISEANVKVRLNRAKTMLREELSKSYAPQELYEFNLVYCDAMVLKVMARINEL